MYIKESIIRLIYIFLFITFAGCLFFTTRYLSNAGKVANNPSNEVISANANSVDQKTLEQILIKVQ
ncbi:TPA: hypothetical protein DD449_04620 [Candidatus Berkelbacteria bacterium]|nr:hypothetical protein [Candidatus Berkelbacteria bacterium]